MSTFWQYFRPASSELLSELLCFTPVATTKPTGIFGCPNAPVANKSKDTARPLLLSAAAMGRDYSSLPRYLPASFITTAANVATPRNTVLQHAGVG
jgi:hypothetical protein